MEEEDSEAEEEIMLTKILGQVIAKQSQVSPTTSSQNRYAVESLRVPKGGAGHALSAKVQRKVRATSRQLLHPSKAPCHFPPDLCFVMLRTEGVEEITGKCLQVLALRFFMLRCDVSSPKARLLGIISVLHPFTTPQIISEC